MAAGAPERPPARRNADGFRYGIEGRPEPVQLPERDADEGIQVDRGEHPGAPPETEHQAEGKGQVPHGEPAGRLGRERNPGSQMQQRQR
ncbi:hypothetical protein D9M70_614600 [compost metagenome]